MFAEPAKPIIINPLPANGLPPSHGSAGWGAILAGTVAAIGIHLLLTTLGVGSGLAILPPITESAPVAAFGMGAGLGWSLLAILALTLGGWVAGFSGGCPRRGWLLGALVWSLTVAVTLPWLVLGTSRAMHRAMKMSVEEPLNTDQAVVDAERELARTVVQRNQAELDSFVEEAVESIPTNAAPKASTRAQREVGLAVTKLFAPGNIAGWQTNRDGVINVLMVYTEMSVADATITVDAWILSEAALQSELTRLKVAVDELKTDRKNFEALAEQVASAATDRLAHRLARLARWTGFALLLGLIGAALGGRCGAECAGRRADGSGTPGKPV